MYIACPECNTKFIVTQTQIGTHGRKVKCSKCAHVWHQKVDSKVKIEPALTAPIAPIPLGKGVNLPALLPIRVSPYLYTLPVFMIGMIIFMVVMLFPNKLLGTNSILNNDKLSIKDIKIVNEKDLGKITVNYKVLNSSSNTTKMPLIRIRLFDKNSRMIKSLIDDHSNINMAPNQLIEVKAEFVPAPRGVESIDIMIGNKIDFILR